MPVYSYRWKDIAASDSKEELEKLIVSGGCEYRIEDTRAGIYTRDEFTINRPERNKQ